jgi:hypothetical protein
MALQRSNNYTEKISREQLGTICLFLQTADTKKVYQLPEVTKTIVLETTN